MTLNCFSSPEIPQKFLRCNAQLWVISTVCEQRGTGPVQAYDMRILVVLQERRVWLQQPWNRLTGGGAAIFAFSSASRLQHNTPLKNRDRIVLYPGKSFTRNTGCWKQIHRAAENHLLKRSSLWYLVSLLPVECGNCWFFESHVEKWHKILTLTLKPLTSRSSSFAHVLRPFLTAFLDYSRVTLIVPAEELMLQQVPCSLLFLFVLILSTRIPVPSVRFLPENFGTLVARGRRIRLPRMTLNLNVYKIICCGGRENLLSFLCLIAPMRNRLPFI